MDAVAATLGACCGCAQAAEGAPRRARSRQGHNDDGPLTAPRPPEWRLLGNCRDFSVLLCALLRHQGTSARARCGFATYLGPAMHADHWICEYWSAEKRRWVQVDAELDETHCRHLAIDFDPCDLPPGRFLAAGQAWLLCREKAADSRQFGFNARLRGLPYIRGNLLRDMLALNKLELLYEDH